MTVKSPTPGRRTPRGRWVPLAAAVTAATLTVAAVASAGGGAAGAATAPNAQSAGNFVDATIGGNPIDNIAKLAFARAQNPGSVTDQNPLDVTALNTINLPLTGALQLPKLLGITLGAVNQVALARSTGQSYGASGAVLNSGGVSVGGSNGTPANASIDICASSVSGGKCGTGAQDALGEVKASIGAVSSIARTPQFGPALASSWPCGQSAATCYQIADLSLSLDSPLLGSILSSLLSTVATTVNSIVAALNNLLGQVAVLPNSCKLTSPTALTKKVSLDGGALVLDPSNASIKLDLEKVLKSLGLNLNTLPANTDLVTKLLNYLTSPGGLAKGVEGVINNLTDFLNKQYNNCKTALGPLEQLVNGLIAALNSGHQQLNTTINQLIASLSAAGGANPLKPITDLLGQVLDIGVNVQPQVSSGDFKTNLNTLPKQGMTPPPVPYEHTVRAIEVQLLGGAVTLALANSSAGPSHGPVVCCAPPPTTSVPPTNIPTGVPAGAGTHGGSPTLPIVLLALGLMFAAGGVAAYRFRGAINRH